MKNILTLLALVVIVSFASAQVPPQAFNYSAVARNPQGNPIALTTVGIQISILKGSSTGLLKYKENHSVMTDAYGLFNLIIGGGAVQTGYFDSIAWNADSYFIKVGMDATGGTNFLTMGTTQFLSVPYALHAKTAESLSDSIPLSAMPRIAAAGQILSVSFSGGSYTNFSQSSSTCPNLYAHAILTFTQGTNTITINPVDEYYINPKRFDAIFDIPAYAPPGLYNIIVAPATSCPFQMNSSFKIH